MNKKALIVASGGIPSVYAENGVDVVCVDLDDVRVMVENDMIPIHTSYGTLMEFAGVTGDWPVSDDGRIDDADHLEACVQEQNSCGQPGNQNQPISMVVEVECGLVQTIYSNCSTPIKVAIKDMNVEGADGDEMATLDDGTEFVGHIEPVLRNGSLVATVFAAFGEECITADKQQENYVAGKGQVCPVCGSDIINQQGRLQADGGEAWADIFCFGCSASWQDHYQLVGFNDLNR